MYGIAGMVMATADWREDFAQCNSGAPHGRGSYTTVRAVYKPRLRSSVGRNEIASYGELYGFLQMRAIIAYGTIRRVR